MLLAYCHELYTPWEPRRRAFRLLPVRKSWRDPSRAPAAMLDFGNNQDLNQFLVTICQAMGLQTTRSATWARKASCPECSG
jgi:hypothetical protein